VAKARRGADTMLSMSLPLTMALTIKLLFWTAALLVFVRLAARQSGELEAGTRRWSGALLLGALLGSKLVFFLGHPDRVGARDDAANQLLWWISGNSTIGALLGGYLALCLSEGLQRARRLADALATPVASALLILSLGTFFWALRGNGYGSATNLPTGVDFGDGVARHPVMLYEAVCLGLVIWLQHHRQTFSAWRSGLGHAFLIGYSLLVLISGFLKPPFGTPLLLEAIDPAAYLHAGLLTADQWAGAVAALLLHALSLSSARSGKVDSSGAG
jgi:phosphatidylglycerol:prolipoprotein diacylglycerol transferase